MKTKGLLSVFIFLVLASQAFAGWVIEEVTGYAEGEETKQTSYFQNNRIKIVDSEQVMVFDLQKGVFYILSPDREIYWSGTPEQFQEDTKEMVKRQMEKILEGMPPEQREAYKQYLEEIQGEAKKTTTEKKLNVQVQKTSEKATVAGYPTQKYEVWVDEELKQDLWIATEMNLADEIDLNKFAKFIEALSELEEEETYESSPQYMALLGQGYWLRSIEYDEEGEETVTEVVKAEKKKIPDSEFAVPKSYGKVSIEELWQQEQSIAE